MESPYPYQHLLNCEMLLPMYNNPVLHHMSNGYFHPNFIYTHIKIKWTNWYISEFLLVTIAPHIESCTPWCSVMLKEPYSLYDCQAFKRKHALAVFLCDIQNTKLANKDVHAFTSTRCLQRHVLNQPFNIVSRLVWLWTSVSIRNGVGTKFQESLSWLESWSWLNCCPELK